MKKKVLVVGWDAADWRVIHPLLDAGKMPALASMIDNGVMGNLATLYPPLSPMMWTSISTGKRPYKHGILGFSEPTQDGTNVQPISVLSRRGKAVWNILQQVGYQCSVVGWWPSHPVEPVNGVMVSNHYQHAVGPPDQPWPVLPGTIHPPRLEKELAALRLNPNELGAEHLLPFIPLAREIDQDKDRRLASCAKIIAECTSIHAAATHIMAREPWDFMGVYYDAIDHFCHGYMKYHPPRREHIPERDYELYHNVVNAGYMYHDMMLGTLLQLAGDDTTVIVVSDHGFHPDHLRPKSIPKEPAGPAVEHRDFGIVVMKGPDIRKDEHIYGASLLDITPTILAHCGLPLGEDMDGRVLVDAFESPVPVESIPTWDEVEGDDGCHPEDKQFDPLEAKEALEQLIALGYIERPDGNQEASVARTVRELNYNLARSYMDAGLHGEAEPLLADMYAKEPGEHRLGLHLAMCYRALDRVPELSRLIDTMHARRQDAAKRAQQELKQVQEVAKQRKATRQAQPEHVQTDNGTGEDPGTPGNDTALFTRAERNRIEKLRSQAHYDTAAFDFLSGCRHLAEGNLVAAVAAFKSAEAAAPDRVAMHLHLGEAHLGVRNWQGAARSYRRAQALDPENPHAHLGLARTLLGRRKNLEGAKHALKAVGLLYFYPIAHFYLGGRRIIKRRIDRAIEALEVALKQNPNFFEVHDRLAHIYENRVNNPAKAKEHKALARQLRTGKKRLMAQSEHTPLPVLAAPEEPYDWSERATPVEGKNQRILRLGNSIRKTNADTAPVPSEDVITVVSGLPRSGTSMMMQMLRAGGLSVLADDTRQADEDNPRGYLELEAAKRLRQEHAWLEDSRGKVVKVIAQLIPALPLAHAYRVIFMERNLEEVLASQHQMLERIGATGANLSESKLKQLFARQVRATKRLLKAQKITSLYVPYRDAINDPAGVAQTVNAFLGGACDEDAMTGTVSADLYRQRASSPKRRATRA